jgi:hypothetical protein
MHGPLRNKPEDCQNKEGKEDKFQFRGQGTKKTMPALFRMTETYQRDYLMPSSTTDPHQG